MSGQEQINQSTDQEIQNLETIIQQLESEIINVETTIECQTLKRVTINFLQILKARANAKIQALKFNCGFNISYFRFQLMYYGLRVLDLLVCILINLFMS